MITQTIVRSASARKRRIAFGDATDPRVISAAIICYEQEVCEPVLVVSSEEEKGQVRPQLPASGIDVITALDTARQTTDHLLERRSFRGLQQQHATELARNPLYAAGAMIARGDVHGAVAGSLSSTADVVRAAIWTVGTRPGISLVSSFFLMAWPDRTLLYADCGVVPQPTPSQLAEIADSAAENYRRLAGADPRLAFLSFSTKGSAEHPLVDHVRLAFQEFQRRCPDVIADGEVQFDAAFVPSVGARKAPGSPLAGDANVFIFPNLDAGNIAYKITERIGGAVALGPILQGLSKPYCDLSRGCSADDIVIVAAITSLMSD